VTFLSLCLSLSLSVSHLVHPLHYSPFYHILFLTSTGFSVPYSYMYREYTNHIHPPLPFSFTLTFPVVPSSAVPCFVQWEFCLSILPVNIL
jgi:hypothetical protein